MKTVEQLFDLPQPLKGEVLAGLVLQLPSLGYAEEDILFKVLSAAEKANGTKPFKTLQELVANQEGWGVFENTDGRGHKQLQIQKLDGADIFGNDADAWEFLAKQIQNGSNVHTEALNTVADEERKEIVELTSLVLN